MDFDILEQLLIKIRRRVKVMAAQFYAEYMLPAINDDASSTLKALQSDDGSSCLTYNDFDIQYDLHIIVPVYMVEKYIKTCMDSILNQETQFSYCVTVINDGSPDASRSILKEYEHLSNVYIIDQDNQGFSGARNSGLRLIRGKYITFVDSDDLMTNIAIEELMTKAIELDADIVEGSYDEIDLEGKRLRHIETVATQNSDHIRGYPWGKVYRNSVFKNIHFPEKYWFEDTVIFFIVQDLANKKARISECVYQYRKNPKGISATSMGNPKTIDSFYVMQQLMKDRKRLGLPFDIAFYNKFLYQIGMNYHRTLPLCNGRVISALFSATQLLRTKYFGDLRTTNAKFKLIEHALITNNPKLYAKALK